MTQAGQTTRSTAPIVFFLSMLVLAVVVHLGQAMPAKQKLIAKTQQLENLRSRIANERRISETLAVQRNCLGGDLQTIEGEMRSRGFARPGDRVFQPVNIDSEPK